MIHFTCDRCRKELGPGEHFKVEISGRRKDTCAGECRDGFEKLREIEKQMALRAVADLRQRMQELEARYLRGEPIGSPEEVKIEVQEPESAND